MSNRFWNSPAVRVLHLPTGIEATCDNERSQHRNKRAALDIVRAKLHAKAGGLVPIPPPDGFYTPELHVNEEVLIGDWYPKAMEEWPELTSDEILTGIQAVIHKLKAGGYDWGNIPNKDLAP